MMSEMKQVEQRDRDNEINPNILESLIPLLIKASYDLTLNGLLLEHLFMEKNNKDQLEKYRQAAAEQMEKRLAKEDIEDPSLKIERLNQKLKQNLQLIESQNKRIAQYKENEEKYMEYIHKAKKISEYSKKQNEQMLDWINGLIEYMKINYSRTKSNETLIEEFARENPPPQGIRL